MRVENLQPGDVVYAAQPIYNDGSLPGVDESALIANTGERGVIITTGHLEENPNKTLILVRFDDAASQTGLGPAVACWTSELRAESEIN